MRSWPTIRGISYHVLLGLMLLLANGYSSTSSMPTVLWSATKRDGCFEGSLSVPGLIFLRLSVLLSSQPPSAPCCPWPSLATGRFISWM